jgi:hypothetical protein
MLLRNAWVLGHHGLNMRLLLCEFTSLRERLHSLEVIPRPDLGRLEIPPIRLRDLESQYGRHVRRQSGRQADPGTIAGLLGRKTPAKCRIWLAASSWMRTACRCDRVLH